MVTRKKFKGKRVFGSTSICNERLSSYFYRMLRFYCKDRSPIVDATYGKGNLWNIRSLNEFRPYIVDIDKEMMEKVNYDKKIVDSYENIGKYVEKASVIIFDPPYICSPNRLDILEKIQYKFVKGIDEYMGEFDKMNKVVDKVLDKDGLYIVKCNDFIYEDKFYNVVDIINKIPYKLKDILVYKYLKPALLKDFSEGISSRQHSYFLIYEKE